MSEYHKIQSIFKRDPETKHKTFLFGQYTLPEFEYLSENNWIWHEKVDGTNIRIMLDDQHYLTFGGRTDAAQLPGPLLTHLIDVFFPLKEKLIEMFPSGVVLYGEGYGGKIQKAGSTYGPEQKFVMFDILVNNVWLAQNNVNQIGEVLDVPTVPLILFAPIQNAMDMVEEGFNSTWGDFIAEGLVGRPATEIRTNRGARVITKIKHVDFMK
jgi:hypothetical protein